jgi:phage shock protein C
MESFKKLYRSRTNRMIAGVAGGIAEYLNMDPTIVRIVAVLLMFAGIGIPAYIVGWIIIPEDPLPEAINKESKMPADKPIAHDHNPATHHRPHDVQQSRTVIGIILIALGAAFLVQETFGWNIWSHAWPAILIIIGLVIMLKRR